MKRTDLIESEYYWLKSPNEPEPSLVYYYLHPQEKILGFGFNISDGSGFLPISDLMDDSEIIPITISPSKNNLMLQDEFDRDEKDGKNKTY